MILYFIDNPGLDNTGRVHDNSEVTRSGYVIIWSGVIQLWSVLIDVIVNVIVMLL